MRKYSTWKLIKNVLVNFFKTYNDLDYLLRNVSSDYKSSKLLGGKILSDLNKNKEIAKLSDAEFQVFSQFGDDGIIQYLVNNLPIKNKTFVEFGVENYRESNTRFLLINDNWSGLVIEGNPKMVKEIKCDPISTFYDLQVENSFIDAGNINAIIEKANFRRDLGILSVDIDGVDYWVLKNIVTVEPRILIVEYNSLFGFQDAFTVPYDPQFVRGQLFPFNFYGSSLKSIYDLAVSMNYSFIGCNSAGNNAYFVKNDIVGELPLNVITLEEGYVFASFTEVWDNDGVPLRGYDKIESIDNLTVYNTCSGQLDKVNSKKIIMSLDNSFKSKRL
jgi:hypothetical protein